MKRKSDHRIFKKKNEIPRTDYIAYLCIHTCVPTRVHYWSSAVVDSLIFFFFFSEHKQKIYTRAYCAYMSDNLLGIMSRL